MVNNVVEFQNGQVFLGWKTKVEKKRLSFKLTVNKYVAVGCGLCRGQEIFGYYTTIDGRPVAFYFLDGKERNNGK